MAQQDKDSLPQSSGAGGKPDSERLAAEAVGGDRARPDDEAIFQMSEGDAEGAPAAAEHDGLDPSRAEEAEEPQAEAFAAATLEPEAPPRRVKNRPMITLLIATLGLVATIGAIGAYVFKDKHEKLRAFSALIDETFAPSEGLVSATRENSAKPASGGAVSSGPSNPAATATGQDPPTAPAPRDEATEKSGAKSAAESAAESSKPTPQAQDNDERITWSAPAPAPSPTPPVNGATDAGGAAGAVEALAKRIDQLEQVARSALQVAEDARSAVKQAPGDASSLAPTPEEGNYLNALEGRIDELASEIRVVREKLEAPKSDTRLPQEQADVRSPSASNPAVIVVVAQLLQRELERGSPFVSEYAALSAQGADPEALAALASSAETGAPTARQLLASFNPVAKRLRAMASPKSDAPYADQLWQGVNRLVKIRPAGEAVGDSIPDVVGRIEAALARGDVAAATDAFAKLPDHAKSEAQAWAETANRRRDAEKAAASLLSGAIAALGRTKS